MAEALFDGKLGPVYETAGAPSGGGYPVTRAQASPKAAVAADLHAPTSNTDAVVTYAAAGAGISHVLSGVLYSYNGDPTGGTLRIEDGATLVRAVNVTTKGPGQVHFDPPLRFSANTALTIKLLAGGASVSGVLCAEAHWTETQ